MSSLYSSAPLTSSTPLTDKQTPSSDVRVNVIAIALGIVGVVVVAVIIFVTFRLKRRRSTNGPDGSESFASPVGQESLDRSHPAVRITPFGSPGGETPRFKHTPGSDMRIAMRRPDGAWQFADPRAPFTPSGVSELDVIPSPSSSTAMLPPRVRAKEHESKASRDIRMEYDRDYDIEANPPPAYGNDYGGYIHHTKN